MGGATRENGRGQGRNKRGKKQKVVKVPMTIDEIRAYECKIVEGADVALRLPFEARCEFEERLIAVSRALRMFSNAQRYPRAGVAGRPA
eukprot:7564214-Alexandrium_andersonii.AAC.1